MLVVTVFKEQRMSKRRVKTKSTKKRQAFHMSVKIFWGKNLMIGNWFITLTLMYLVPISCHYTYNVLQFIFLPIALVFVSVWCCSLWFVYGFGLPHYFFRLDNGPINRMPAGGHAHKSTLTQGNKHKQRHIRCVHFIPCFLFSSKRQERSEHFYRKTSSDQITTT